MYEHVTFQATGVIDTRADQWAPGSGVRKLQRIATVPGSATTSTCVSVRVLRRDVELNPGPVEGFAGEWVDGCPWRFAFSWESGSVARQVEVSAPGGRAAVWVPPCDIVTVELVATSLLVVGGGQPPVIAGRGLGCEIKGAVLSSGDVSRRGVTRCQDGHEGGEIPPAVGLPRRVGTSTALLEVVEQLGALVIAVPPSGSRVYLSGVTLASAAWAVGAGAALVSVAAADLATAGSVGIHVPGCARALVVTPGSSGLAFVSFQCEQ